MRNLIVTVLAVLALGACSNPASPLDTLLLCDTIDRVEAANTDAAALTTCDSFDRSQPVS